MRSSLSCRIALLILFAVPVYAESLVLLGNVQPPLQRGLATLSAVQSSFYAEAAVTNSRFRFHGLKPGGYTLNVLDPEWGVTQQTIQVTPSFSNAAGQVHVEVKLNRSHASRHERVQKGSSVSVSSLKVSPKAKATLRKAHRKLGAGAEKEGIALLHKAVELSPTFIEAWNELGTIAYKSEQYKVAEGYFRTALEHEPLAFAPMVNLGGALLSQSRFEEALAYNLMAWNMQPRDALANSQLGMNYFHKQQFTKALEYLRRAKDADRGHFSYPQVFLAEIYGKQGNLEEARQELKELLSLHPDSPVAVIASAALHKLDQAMQNNLE